MLTWPTQNPGWPKFMQPFQRQFGDELISVRKLETIKCKVIYIQFFLGGAQNQNLAKVG